MNLLDNSRRERPIRALLFPKREKRGNTPRVGGVNSPLDSDPAYMASVRMAAAWVSAGTPYLTERLLKGEISRSEHQTGLAGRNQARAVPFRTVKLEPEKPTRLQAGRMLLSTDRVISRKYRSLVVLEKAQA